MSLGWFRISNDFVDSGALALLTPTAALVYLILLRHANQSGECWPAYSTIRKETGIRSDDTVDRALKKLKENGLISIKGRKGDVNHYKVSTTPKNRSGDAANHPQKMKSFEHTSSTGIEEDHPQNSKSTTPKNRRQRRQKKKTKEKDGAPQSLKNEQVDRKEGIPNEQLQSSLQFDAFWTQYPKRKGRRARKQAAIKEWDKLPGSDKTVALDLLPAWNKSLGDTFPPDACRYLSERRWEDEFTSDDEALATLFASIPKGMKNEDSQ